MSDSVAAASAAQAPLEGMDTQGRKLTFKAMDPADMLDLLEASGPNSGNAAWVRMALVVSSVTAIDGVPIPQPKTKEDVRSLARRLGNDGLEVGYKIFYGTPDAPIGDAPEILETAKN